MLLHHKTTVFNAQRYQGADGAATQQCLVGSKAGPNNFTCLAPSWEFQECTPCSSFGSCRTCADHSADCFWCNTTNTCVATGFVGSCRRQPCPCSEYANCGECAEHGHCSFCVGSESCVPKATGCSAQDGPAVNGQCPCSLFGDCQSCGDSDCTWCENSLSCVNSTQATPDCLAAHSCAAFCESLTDCNSCNGVRGCGWCQSSGTCMSTLGVRPNCAKLMLTCPHCDRRSYCDTCIDEEGCTWCDNTASCMISPAPASCQITHSCMSYCQSVQSCETCNQVKGCGWCGDSSTCISVDDASCAFVHSCIVPPPVVLPQQFDAGAFVGGMFLIIGILILAVGGYFFSRWRTGKKIIVH